MGSTLVNMKTMKINITEANKAIAKFMGGRIVRTEDYEMPHGSHSEGTIEHWEFDNYSQSRDEYARIGIFRYDRDWNDLMEVVQKIESMGYIVSNDLSDTTILENKGYAMAFIKVFGTVQGMSKIHSIHSAVTQFVNHYNKTKNEI